MRPVWAEISLDNLKKNLAAIKNITKDTAVMGIVKADGYGHGAVEISKVLEDNGVEIFGVACMDEAEELINAGIRGKILILGCTPKEDWEKAVKLGISLTMCSFDEVNHIKNMHLKPVVHIKIDTGMGRIGFTPEEAVCAYGIIKESGIAEVEGVFTHLSSSDDDPQYTKYQIERFEDILHVFEGVKYKHAYNSGAVLNIATGYNLVRPGIIMYGVVPFESQYKGLFLPVMKLKSKIVFVKRLDNDEYISYGKTYHAKKGSVIATIPAGYADGISRKLSNKGEVEIKGRKCSIIGRVCMDQLMVEIPEDIDVIAGDEVTIFGGMISVEEMADKAETIPYEILTCINKRVPRIYIKNGRIIEMKSLIALENYSNDIDM